MTNLLFSSILHNISSAIVFNIVLAAILWLLLCFIKRSIKLAAKTVYFASYTALTILFFSFIAMLLYAPNDMSHTDLNIINKENTNNYISILYIILLTIVSIYKIVFLLKNNRDKNSEELAKKHWINTFLADKIADLQIKNKINVLLSKTIQSPYTKGILTPIIVLPIAIVNQLSISQTKAILIHELAHIKRYDYLLNAWQIIMETLLYFNPFMYLLSQQIRESREMACDDIVLENSDNRIDYSEALFAIAKIKSKNNNKLILNQLAKGNTHSELINRVHHILNVPVKSNSQKSYFKSFGLGITAILSLFFILQTNKEGTRKTNGLVATKNQISFNIQAIDNQDNKPIINTIPIKEITADKHSKQVQAVAESRKPTLKTRNDMIKPKSELVLSSSESIQAKALALEIIAKNNNDNGIISSELSKYMLKETENKTTAIYRVKIGNIDSLYAYVSHFTKALEKHGQNIIAVSSSQQTEMQFTNASYENQQANHYITYNIETEKALFKFNTNGNKTYLIIHKL